MGKRRKAREHTLCILYQMEFRGEGPGQILEEYISSHKFSEEVKSFIHDEVRGVWDHLKPIDKLIGEYSQHWSLPRISVVDKNILRIAIYEMLFCKDIPEKVSINEAVEIAKKYGAKDSGRFVNGVLDKIKENLKKKPGKPLPGDKK